MKRPLPFLTLLLLLTASVLHGSPLLEIRFWLFFADEVPAGLEDNARALAQSPEFGFALHAPPSAAQVRVEFKWDEYPKVPLPPQTAFAGLSDGIPTADRDRYAASGRALQLTFSYYRAYSLLANGFVARYIGQLTQGKQIAIWDHEARRLLSAARWQEMRMRACREDGLDVLGLITIDTYRFPSLLRIGSHGMRKFGLPEIVVDEMPVRDRRYAECLVGVTAQAVFDQGLPIDPDTIKLGLSTLKSSVNKEGPGATLRTVIHGDALITLRRCMTKNVDEAEELYRVDCDFVLPFYHERCRMLFSNLFSYAFDSPAFEPKLEARNQAMSISAVDFADKRQDMRRALANNERVELLVSLGSGGNQEFVVVLLSSWDQENTLRGILQHAPMFQPGLEAGAEISFQLGQVADYRRFHRGSGQVDGDRVGRFLGGWVPEDNRASRASK